MTGMTRPPIDPSNVMAIEGILAAVRQGADVVCDRWSLSLIIAAFMGDRRFSDFRQRTGLASRLATMRLRTLLEQGLLVQLPYSIRPLRHEYHLTNMGRAFLPVIVQMVRWEQQWNLSAGQGARRLGEVLCGGQVAPALRCQACGEVAGARDIRLKIILSQLTQKPPKQALHRRSTRNSGNAAGELTMLGESLDLFGDKWGVELLVCAFTRIRRFNDFRSSTGISANILSDRLARMVEAGILRRADDADGDDGPGYRLTAKGLDSYGVLVALQDWSDAWLSQRFRSPVHLIHRACGRQFHPLSCTVPDAQASAGDTRLA
jgi:DNA-binding HxlR family transcriptional regulator